MFEDARSILYSPSGGTPAAGTTDERRRQTTYSLFPRASAILNAEEPPEPPEPLISRAARGLMNATGAVGEALSKPWHGLGMLATAAQESLANPEADIGAAPGSRLRVGPSGEVTSPSLSDLWVEGIRAPAALSQGAYDASKPAGEAIGGDDAITRRGFAQGPYRPLAQAEAIAEPIAKMGVQFVTDPALVGLGVLSKAATAGRLTRAGLAPLVGEGIEAAAPAAGILPDAELAAAAQKAMLVGGRAGLAERAIGASFVPGMVAGAVQGARHFMQLGRQEGFTSPEALGAGTSSVIDAAMALLVGKHAATPHTGIPAELRPGVAAAQDLDLQAATGGRERAAAREFLTPDTEAEGIAAAARSMREQLAARQAAEEADRAQQAGFFTPDLDAQARANAARATRERLIEARAELAARNTLPSVWSGQGPFEQPLAGPPEPGQLAFDRLRAAGVPDVWKGPEEPPEAPSAGTPPGPPPPPPPQAPPEAPQAPAPAPPAPPQEPPIPLKPLFPPGQEGIAAAAERQPLAGLLIPKRDMQALADLGYDQAARNKLTGDEARTIIAEQRRATPPPPVAQPGTGPPEPAPSPAQMEAGNYQKGHLRWHGMDVSIETQKGGERVAKDGSWRVPNYPADYGYIKGSEGKDGDQVDVFMGDHPTADAVYVVDTVDPKTGKFDEHKAMVGFRDQAHALDTFRQAYTDAQPDERIGGVTRMTPDEFKQWVREGDTKKPLAKQPERAPAAAAETPVREALPTPISRYGQGRIPTDEIPDEAIRKKASDHALKLAKAFAKTGKMDERAFEDLPEDLRPYTQQVRDEAALGAASLIQGRDFLDDMQRQNPEGPDGLRVILPGGVEGDAEALSQPGKKRSFYVFQRKDGKIIGGAQVGDGVLHMIAGGRAFDSPESIRPVYEYLKREGVQRNGIWTLLGAKSDREALADRQRATMEARGSEPAPTAAPSEGGRPEPRLGDQGRHEGPPPGAPEPEHAEPGRTARGPEPPAAAEPRPAPAEAPEPAGLRPKDVAARVARARELLKQAHEEGVTALRSVDRLMEDPTFKELKATLTSLREDKALPDDLRKEVADSFGTMEGVVMPPRMAPVIPAGHMIDVRKGADLEDVRLSKRLEETLALPADQAAVLVQAGKRVELGKFSSPAEALQKAVLKLALPANVEVGQIASIDFLKNVLDRHPEIIGKKPAVTPQVPNEPGAKYVLPSFATAGAEKVPSNEVTVAFSGKPPKATRARLKEAGFRWDSQRNLWSAKSTDGTYAIASTFRGEKGVTVSGVGTAGMVRPIEKPKALEPEVLTPEEYVETGDPLTDLANRWNRDGFTHELADDMEGWEGITPKEAVELIKKAPGIEDTFTFIRDAAEKARPGGAPKPIEAEGRPVEERPERQIEAAPKLAGRGAKGLADEVGRRLEAGEAIKDNRELQALADEAFGGTRGEGKYTPRDAYDALETGVNRWIMDNGGGEFPDGVFDPTTTNVAKDRTVLGKLRELLKRLPTQTDRTREQVELQQFSTPPTQAFVAAKALGIRPGEVLLEPSAGTGSLAVWAKLAGADVHVNEIAPRRAELLKSLGFDPTTVDAEHLNDLLPDRIKPTAILMNPPFSATGGRVLSHKTEFGARHVEQALSRLEPGGRLVAIVGEGMKFPEARPAEGPRVATGAKFAKWWDGIMGRYSVKANVGIPGEEYGKYGTTFPNQIIVIDKTGPTEGASPAERLQNVVSGRMVSLEDALNALRPIADSRPEAPEPGAVGMAPKPGRPVEPGRAGLEQRPGGREAGGGIVGVRPGAERPPVPERPAGEAPQPVQAPEPEPRPAPDEGQVRAGGGGPAAPVPGKSGVTEPTPPPPPTAVVSTRTGPVERETEEGGTFVRYVPAKLSTKGLAKHPADVVEAASMAAVEPPDISYRSALPEHVTKEGRLSDLQYETVLYAGQRHAQTLPDGKRGGYFIGDGTGVGKGREIAGVVLDNWHQGRKRTVWVSVSRDLLEDARRDLDGVAGKKAIPIVSINDFPITGDIRHPEGVVFTTYNSLISKPKGEKGKAPAPDAGRLEQLKRWLGPDGVIVFDEAHKAKNALAQGRAQPTQTGQAVIKLQNDLPGARVVYVSATGATDVRNMAYMTRLGLWAPDRAPTVLGQAPRGPAAEVPSERFAFPGGFNEFLNEVEGGGVGAKEMVSRDLKALGMYNSRSISFKGVDYRERIHELTPDQKQMYDASAKAWQIVLQNIDTAIENYTKGGRGQRTQAMKRFWNDHQRFFRQVTTAMKMPTILAEVEDALKNNESAIVTLKGTGEAATAAKVTKAAAEGQGLEELDFTPRETITQMVEAAFPTQAYEEVQNPMDPTQTMLVPVMRPAMDAEGKPILKDDGTPQMEAVHNKEALALKQQTLDQLSDLSLPENPLDQFVNHFGPSKVAEMTGRKRRLIRDPNTGKVSYEKRAGDGVAADKVNLHEMRQFQSGKKRIAVISRAASTGISLHSSLQEKNQQRRRQIAAELDWSADSEMQTFGRSHRSDQKIPPTYVLISTDVGGEKRFSSTIARRLASLGALTKGQRDATGGGELAKYNFETPEGEAALESLYSAMVAGKNPRYGIEPVEGIEDPQQTLKDMGLLKEPKGGGTPSVDPSDMRDIPRFLNRVLALNVDRQNVLFNDFVRRFGKAVDRAKENGTFDEGVADIKANSLRVKGEPTLIHKDPITGAETRHFALEADEPVPVFDWKGARGWAEMFARNEKSGRLVAVRQGAARTDAATGQTRLTMLLRNNRGRYESIPREDFLEKYTPIGLESRDIDQAKKDWDASVEKLPKTEQVEHHVIAGSILPIWQKLKGDGEERLKIVRAQADDGQRIVGVEIPKPEVGRVLQSLGVGRTFEGPDQIFRAVLEQGDTVGLAENISLRKVRVHGEPRIEIAGIKSSRMEQLRNMGAIEERIDFRNRFFVPTDAEAAKPVMEKLLKAYPPEGGPESGGPSPGDAALKRLQDRATGGTAYSLAAAGAEGPAIIKDAAIYGASLIHKGLRRFADWSERMVTDLGSFISDIGKHLRRIFSQSVERAASTPPPTKPPVTEAAPAGGGPPAPRKTTAEALFEDSVTASNAARKLADSFTATNRKFEIAQEGAERVAERGTIEKGVREEFRGEGQPAPGTTEHFLLSEARIKEAGAQLVEAVRQFKDAERHFNEAADPTSAHAMRLSRQIMEQAVKNWQVYRTAAGRAVKTFDRPIPQDVIDRLNEAGMIAGNIRNVRARAPIASNILESLKHWDTLNEAEKKRFARDLVDHFRLNLFSVTSWTLDAIGNAAELAGQAGAGVGHDLVQVARGNPTFPSLQGAFRAIRANPAFKELAPDVEHALETTVAGERLKKEAGQGVFTYRKGLGSKLYDYGVGAPLYWKGFFDTAAKRMGALWTLNRDAIEAAREKGLQGADREQFIERWIVNPPPESLARAMSNGKKAGFNRDLSRLEENIANSTTARLLVDSFARWPFQFTRWAAEMLGFNPELWHKFRAGSLRAEDVGEYLGKAAVGIGGLMLINGMYNRVDFNSMEYVDKDGNRIRLSNRDPIPTALWLLAVIKAGAAEASGDKKARDQALAKATASLQNASIPGARLLAGQGGLLGGTIKAFLTALENPQNDPRALRKELEDTINRAIPGQALLSALKTAFDPTLREGIGAQLPGVSLALPPVINPVTGQPLQSRQRVPGVPFELPAIGGTPIPGATRIIEPVQKLLARFGLLVYRGPRSPIAGYPPGQVPEEMRTEWQQVFGEARNRLLSPLVRYASMQNLGEHEQESIRKKIQERDRIAAEMANREMRRRHGGPRKLPRQEGRREMAAPDIFQERRGG